MRPFLDWARVWARALPRFLALTHGTSREKGRQPGFCAEAMEFGPEGKRARPGFEKLGLADEKTKDRWVGDPSQAIARYLCFLSRVR